jgi:hypothetical protein
VDTWSLVAAGKPSKRQSSCSTRPLLREISPSTVGAFTSGTRARSDLQLPRRPPLSADHVGGRSVQGACTNDSPVDPRPARLTRLCPSRKVWLRTQGSHPGVFLSGLERHRPIRPRQHQSEFRSTSERKQPWPDELDRSGQAESAILSSHDVKPVCRSLGATFRLSEYLIA